MDKNGIGDSIVNSFVTVKTSIGAVISDGVVLGSSLMVDGSTRRSATNSAPNR